MARDVEFTPDPANVKEEPPQAQEWEDIQEPENKVAEAEDHEQPQDPAGPPVPEAPDHKGNPKEDLDKCRHQGQPPALIDFVTLGMLIIGEPPKSQLTTVPRLRRVC